MVFKALNLLKYTADNWYRAVNAQFRKDKQMAQAMGIGGVSTLVVNEKYKPNFDQLKTPDNILELTQQLLDQD